MYKQTSLTVLLYPILGGKMTWGAMGLEKAVSVSQAGRDPQEVKEFFLHEVARLLEEDAKESRPFLSQFQQASRVFFNVLCSASEDGPELPVWMPSLTRGREFVYVRFLKVLFSPEGV